jgi:competence protein ComEC
MANAQLQTGFFAPATWAWSRLFDRIDNWLEEEAESLPLWMPVMLGAGIASWWLLPGSVAYVGALVIAIALAILGAVAGARTRRWASALMIGSLCVGIGLTLMWLRAEWVAAPVIERPVVVLFDAHIVDIEPIPARGDLRLLLRPMARTDMPPQVRVTMPIDAPAVARLAVGRPIRLRARLMPPPRAALPSGYDFAARAWFDRIGAVGSVLGDVQLPAAARGQMSLRQSLSVQVRRAIDGDAGGVAAALATGDRGGISPEAEEAMRRSGLAHLLSVSGLHISAAVGATYWLALRLLALFPYLALRLPLTAIAAAAGALVGLGYTVLTGAEVPTVRSLIAAVLVLMAIIIGREALTLRLVAAGALAVMLVLPESIASPSFQLSFAAVTAIVALHSQPTARGWFLWRDEPTMARLARGLGSVLLTGIVVELALMPIALFHFHKAGLYGALANVLAIPLTTFIIMPTEALALLLDSVGLGAPLWWLAERALLALLWLAFAVAEAPGAVAALPAMPWWAFAGAIFGGLWLTLWQQRHRLLGVIPITVALIWTASLPAPDLLVTSDGRHVATRLADGRYALLRGRAGEFVREQMAEAAGSDHIMSAVADLPQAQCNRDFCRWQIDRGGRRWTILAARTRDRSDWQSLIDACAAADIVIADRWLPQACTPRWLKIDRAMLEHSGGLAINLSPPSVRAARDRGRGKPWDEPPTVAGDANGR